MKATTIAAGLGWGVLALAAWAAEAQMPSPSTRPDPSAVPPAVATVGSRSIPRPDFEQRVRAGLSEYQARSGSELSGDLLPMVRRQILESMIRIDLLTLEAQRRGIAATVAEAEEQLKRDPFFNPGGRFDADRWSRVRDSGSPSFQDALRQIRMRLAAQKLSQKIELERAPSESLLRAVAERSLRHVSLDYLALRGETFDGGYPEPRETDILNAYRARPADYYRPDRAVLSIVFIDRPAPAEGQGDRPAERHAWDARMKQSADSAIATLRAGASFDTLAARFGVRHDVVVTRDNFPGYWQGNASNTAAVFATPPGEVLHEPIPGRPGYLVVRVDRMTPGHVAPLAQVSRDIRARLREDARAHRDNLELRPIYDQMADSLTGPAIRLRYAVIDTLMLDSGQPAEADLDRYYRGHMADYSSFDDASASIRTRPLGEVRDDVTTRWKRDRRRALARSLTEDLQRVWSTGRRDVALERSAALVKDVGPIPIGAPVDSGLAGAAVTEALAAEGGRENAGSAPYARGAIVFQVLERMPRYRPTFEQARAALAEIRDQRQSQADEAGGRALFERQPEAFALGEIIHYSRLMVLSPDPRDVHLTRAEVERYHHRHFDRYSASEILEARHILISPTGPGAQAERAARARADSILDRIRAGEDFAQIARRTSDDPATREQGGDLGQFGRGVMLDDFEKAAFGMRPGDLAGPIRSPVGWHIIKCLSHLPIYSQPLEWIYGNVGYDAALEKADSIAARRADSLFRHVRTAAQARAVGAGPGYEIVPATFSVGTQMLIPDMVPFFDYLVKMKPGQLYPGVTRAKGLGYVLSWVDSITPPERPTWEDARSLAIERYRRGAGGRAMRAKCAELDSILATGWSFDSLATLWGGLERADDIGPAAGISAIGGGGWVLDSLAFGARGGAGLAVGARSGWQSLPLGYGMFRLRANHAPSPGQLAAKMQNDLRQEMDLRLSDFFDELKHRYPIRILDPVLREVSLPPLRRSPLE